MENEFPDLYPKLTFGFQSSVLLKECWVELGLEQ